MEWRRIEIPKGDGRVRVVYDPSPELREQLATALPSCEDLARRTAADLGVGGVPHGCVPGRGPRTMVLPHVGGWAWTVSVDLRSAFDSVGHLLPDGVPLITLLDGRPPQGSPCSPALCNAALARLDRAILDALEVWAGARLTRRDDSTTFRRAADDGAATTYTRYVDDLVVSGSAALGDPLACAREAVALVEATVRRLGLEPAPQKSRIQLASAGRRVVVGLSVGPEGISAPRRTRRRLRALAHQGVLRGARSLAARQARGLAEWCRPERTGAGRADLDRGVDPDAPDAADATSTRDLDWRPCMAPADIDEILEAELRSAPRRLEMSDTPGPAPRPETGEGEEPPSEGATDSPRRRAPLDLRPDGPGTDLAGAAPAALLEPEEPVRPQADRGWLDTERTGSSDWVWAPSPTPSAKTLSSSPLSADTAGALPGHIVPLWVAYLAARGMGAAREATAAVRLADALTELPVGTQIEGLRCGIRGRWGAPSGLLRARQGLVDAIHMRGGQTM